ncbi:MAG: NAD(P)/FAD-dependent oxidoreductase [Firmicutes bacterium]|nr:NAD(P)/FAD-dependent oxidoreductase [Bacillota bacterium]
MRVDVLVIGGGVVGCAIARQLSSAKIKIALAEAREDVSTGASMANSGIVHAGYDATPGSLMARMNVRGNALYDTWCQALEVPLSRVGSLVIAFSKEEEETLQHLLRQGEANGVPDLSIVTGDEARRLEPMLSNDVTAALYAGTGAITCPYQFTIACYENAVRNGVRAFLNAPVTALQKTREGFTAQCGPHAIEAGYVVNAAGLFADDIAAMVGDFGFTIRPRKGEYMLFDRAASTLSRVLFQTPTKMGKGVLVSPTVDGNAYAGPTALDQDERTDRQTTADGMAEIRALSLKSVPALDLRAVITAFAGVRAMPSTGDFILRPSEAAPRMIHAAGICSPGLSSAPAIAEYVAALLKDAGLALPANEDFDPHRPAIRRFAEMTNEERAEAIRQNSLYGRVICRCETITEAEIVEAVRRGGHTLDGVKRRTRAGMGRCQGGFCSPRVMEIISREKGIPMTDITKFGGGSRLLIGKLKEVR